MSDEVTFRLPAPDEFVVYQVAFCLPAPDVIALQKGRSILAIALESIDNKESFLIYPGPLPNTLPLETYYQPNFIPTARRAIAEYEKEQSDPNKSNQTVNLWARCELCQPVSDLAELKTLSELTIWSLDALENIIKKEQDIYFLYLRVHELKNKREIIRKQGGCIGLHTIELKYHLPEFQPVLSDHLWSERYQKILNRQPSPYPELEQLQGAIAQLNTPDSIKFDQYLQTFFGWQEAKPVNLDDLALTSKGEIKHISKLANSSDETKDDLASYMIKNISKLANSPNGPEFEKIVRRSLLALGFPINDSLDPNTTGGAGGMDAYCHDPYPLVAECKASGEGKVDAGVCQQLIRIGTKHLNKNNFNSAIKIIFASGEITDDSKKTAIEHEMNVMSGETLEKLVKLHANHPGCIDLWELKKYLEKEPFGQEANEKIHKYIAEVRERLKVRSQIVQQVKELEKATNSEMSVTEIKGRYNGKYDKDLSKEEVRDILIELSSPLTGYLGRDDHDCFYFVRDFPYAED
jgi:hypothetical protein